MSRTLEQTISNRLVLGKSILTEANLGEKVEIRIQNRSIMILPTIEKKGWNILKELGENAAEGKLENPSVNHDKYIYGAGN